MWDFIFYTTHTNESVKGTPCCSLTKRRSANEQFPQESSRYAQAAAILKFDDVLSKLWLLQYFSIACVYTLKWDRGTGYTDVEQME